MSGLLTAGYAWARDPMRFLCPDSNELDGYDRFETLEQALIAASEALKEGERVWAGPVTLLPSVADDVIRKVEEWRPKRYRRDADGEMLPLLGPADFSSN